MAVPKRRTSKARKAKRRTHYKLPNVTLVKDPQTGEWSVPHRVNRADVK
ncbi:50S ribosomal protein L32 [Erysipelothrix inopinata]|uniref:Large ribosomal subunit protein bL32 n=1 Tax=Erysipelothrix inopinata TaxID=225084 RepID=A0A7G9RYB7_9FIRM|nr:50S ribosomal protein L32 [Erysipelothrix inopinata]QNN60592.1 50S ribosomal protein L32 [Erysipelothrix inopinata]